MDVREKLVELLDNFHRDLSPFAGNEKFFVVDDNVEQAEYLIAHGVTVQENCKACAEATQNCIVKLQEQIAELRSVQEWISVKDRLPEHGDVVMVWHTYMEHPFVCQWDERSDCWIDDKWTFGRNAITHWCRLPQPPKGE